MPSPGEAPALLDLKVPGKAPPTLLTWQLKEQQGEQWMMVYVKSKFISKGQVVAVKQLSVLYRLQGLLLAASGM
jgi:hypothetical protein